MMGRREEALRYFDESRDFMEGTVRENIERYRKGKATLTVTDATGKPLSDATVSLKLKNHEFRHGANIFMLEELETEEKNAAYKAAFPQVCNLATIPFYWSDLEPTEGKPRFAKDSPRIYRRPATDLCLEYCLENGIEPKCHCLNYDSFIPAWLKGADVFTHKKALSRRFRVLAERYRDAIPSWEVTNETLDSYTPTRYHSRFFHEKDFVDWSFREADRYFPNNRLIINDYRVFDESFCDDRSLYYMQIERLLSGGWAHLDSIGMQFHSFFPKESEGHMAFYRYRPEFLYQVMDQYAKFGLPLQITEMTIPAYSNDAEDEELQAELLRKLYTVFFSHPAMEAVIYWNLVDGYAAFAPMGDMTAGENVYHGGLLRFDLSEKPAFRTIRDLFQKEWHTEVTAQTDASGALSFRGFYGDYEVTVTHGGKTETQTLHFSARGDADLKITV